MASLINLKHYLTFSRNGSELLRREASHLGAGRDSVYSWSLAGATVLLHFCLPPQIDFRTGLACRQRVHPGEAEIAGTVAPIRPCFLVFHDGKRRIDVADILTVCNAVEMDEHGVQLGTQM